MMHAGDLPLGAHLALASVSVLAVTTLLTDLGVPELLTAAYYAAIMYGVMNILHAYLREHAPAEPRRARPLPILALLASTALLTVAVRRVVGVDPLALTPENLALATGLFMLFFAAFLDPTTNRALLRRSRDPRRPYAGLPRWVPTWRAATLPVAVLLGLVHMGTIGALAPAWVPVALVAAASLHVASLTFGGRRAD